jgi:carboxymethylenebutenolidase
LGGAYYGRDGGFPSNGTQGEGYLAIPDSGSGPGVLVIQEWWGLNDQIKGVAERLATEGFVALAPDLYRGAHTTEPDEREDHDVAQPRARDQGSERAVDFLGRARCGRR